MPIRYEEVPAEIAVRHGGVCVYHVYRNDEVEQGPRTYLFTLDAYGGETVGTDFDVRSLRQWTPHPGPGEDVHIRRVLVAAIDAGDLTNAAPGQAGYNNNDTDSSVTAPNNHEPLEWFAQQTGSWVIAHMVAAAYDRGNIQASAAEVYEWAVEAVDTDSLWESSIGPAIDEIESAARSRFT